MGKQLQRNGDVFHVTYHDKSLELRYRNYLGKIKVTARDKKFPHYWTHIYQLEPAFRIRSTSFSEHNSLEYVIDCLCDELVELASRVVSKEELEGQLKAFYRALESPEETAPTEWLQTEITEELLRVDARPLGS